MSTAAQQARRKIAQPRGRLGASRSHTPTSNSAPNPFSLNPPPQQQQTFGAVNGAVTFGASQSFPQSSAGNNSSFNFQPPQSSSFTFGAPANAQNIPNPFANLNGSGTSDAEDISMESPQKKAAFGNTFGSNNFNFSKPAEQQSNPFSGLGGTQTANTNGNNLFGQAASTSAPSNPFGVPAQSNPFSGFGQQPSVPQAQTSGFVFGQTGGSGTSTPAASTPAFGGFGAKTDTSSETKTSLFPGVGASTSVAGQNALPAFGAQGSQKLGFGQTSTSTQPPSTGLFASSTTPTPNGNNLFGAVPPQSSSSGFSFGQTSSKTTPAVNPFASLVASKPEEPTSAAPSFGTTTSASQRDESPSARPSSPEKPLYVIDTQPSNPFAGLLPTASSSGQATTASKPLFSFSQPSQAPPSAVEKQDATPAKAPFSFGTTSQPTPKAATEESQPKPVKSPFAFGTISQPAEQPAERSEPKSSASTFNFGSTTPSAGPTTSGLFGKATTQPEASKAPTSSETAEENTAKSKDANPTSSFKFGGPLQAISSGGLFSPAKPSSENISSSGALFGKLNSAVESSSKPQPLFGAQPTSSSAPKASPEYTAAPAEAHKPAPTPLFSGPSSQAPPQNRPEPETQTTSTGFAAQPSSTSQAPAAKASLPAPQATSPAEADALNTQDSAALLLPIKRPVYTKGPNRVPHTTPEQFQEFDRNYRLHSLNFGLQRQIAKLDPRSHDFDKVIRQYVAVRENIGSSLGLYTRNVAGTKRKGDQVDDRDDEPQQSKRSREEPVQKSSSFGANTSFGSGFPANNNTASTPSKANSAPLSTAGATPAAAGFKPTPTPSAGNGANSNAAANPFAALNQGATSAPPAPSTTPVKSPPKKPAFEMPKFGGDSKTNFLAAFGQQAKANSAKFEKDLLEKRKAEEFDSDEDDEEQYRKKVEEESRAKRAKIESIAKAGFKPMFGSASNATDPKPAFTGFGSATSNNIFISTPIGDAKPDAADYEDEDSIDDKDDDENEVSGSSNDQAEGLNESEADDEDEEEREDSLPEDEVVEDDEEEDDDDDNDLQAAMDRARKNPNAGKSLFERIEAPSTKESSTPTTNDDKQASRESSPIMQSAKNASFPPTLWGSHFGKSTPEQPAFSPITPATTSTSTVKPTSTFKFTPSAPIATPTPALGASIFSGGITRDGPVPGEGLFGSRPSTPSNVEKNSNLAKSILTSPAGTDNTWKPGNSISFANGDTSTVAPTLKFTAATPGDKDKITSNPFGSLFGTPTAGSSGTATPNLGFQFGSAPSVPAPGYLAAVSHLGAGSAASSVASSRATSPGLTDNESVATNDTEESTEDPQASLMESRVGEENEAMLWEGRSKALMFVSAETAKGTKNTPNDWNSVGVGILRVLQDKSTKKTRVVFRVEPSANILFNSHLIGSTDYESVPGNKSGAVRGALMHNGALTRLVFKLKTPEMASQLAKILEENKSA
ncbi:hypothetical protein H2200_000415 [Cladophialophora chaetospira]|uniref:RanBD1 domain-containing protein n=1 Tax=Cladophialophora chaetospira TaxID=386627 RepID=A0AA38XNQ4_9EURO|nr:hypothetical protein H2200_000415 [Cladophialophora chaetospira]